jgi:hypothetical protein
MDEQKKGVNLVRILIFSILIVSIVIVILFILFILTGGAHKINDYFSRAVENNDLSECDKVGSGLAAISCKSGASALLKNNSYCESLDSKNPSIYATLKIKNNTYSLKMSERDYCYFHMTNENESYCYNINDNQTKVACIESALNK